VENATPGWVNLFSTVWFVWLSRSVQRVCVCANILTDAGEPIVGIAISVYLK